MFDHGFALGVLTSQVTAETAEFCFAGFIFYVEKEGDVTALEEGMVLGFYSGCEHSEGVFVDEAAKDTEVRFSMGGANIHGRCVGYVLGYRGGFLLKRDSEVFMLLKNERTSQIIKVWRSGRAATVRGRRSHRPGRFGTANHRYSHSKQGLERIGAKRFVIGHSPSVIGPASEGQKCLNASFVN